MLAFDDPRTSACQLGQTASATNSAYVDRPLKVIPFSSQGTKVQENLSPVQSIEEVYPTSLGGDKSLNGY